MQAISEPSGPPGRDRVLQAAASLGVMGAGEGSPARMLALLCNPKAEPGQVAALIKCQPALCARVLRVANSPYYGQSRQVKTVERGFFVLGMDAVRGIAAAACLERTMPAGSSRGSLDMGQLLEHSIATAVTCESLAAILCAGMASDAFIAGLLHHLGMAVQASVDPAGMAAMVAARRQGSTVGIRELELQHGVIPHEFCAGEVFGAWQMPESLIAAAAHHHEPSAAPSRHQLLSALVEAGARLAASVGHGVELEPPGPVGTAEFPLLDLQEDSLTILLAALPQRIHCMRSALRD